MGLLQPTPDYLSNRRWSSLKEERGLSGRVAIITGASRGIGRATSIALAKEGVSVVVNFLKEEREADKTVDLIKETGSDFWAHQADVRNLEEVEEMVRETCDRFGKLDILVNNAGVISDRFLQNMTQDQWDYVVSTNLTGVYNCAQEAVKVMIEQGDGQIISVASVVGQMGNIGQTNYAASKAGVIGFTKALAREVATKGIAVNAVAPGFVHTDMTKGLPEKITKRLLAQIPMGRFAFPEEIADAVVFLAKSTYITGQVINLNGGMY